MRRIAFVAAALIFLGLAVLLPRQVFAVGNVLVPSDDNDSGSSMYGASPSGGGDNPDMLPAPAVSVPSTGGAGLSSPAIDTTSPDVIAKALSAKEDSAADRAALLDPNAASVLTPDQQKMIDDARKAFSSATQGRPLTGSDIMTSPVSDQDAAKLPPGSLRTTIFRSPDMSAILARGIPGMPYRLTLSIGPNSVFGPNDVKSIQDKLGMSRDDIGKSCILTLNGMLQTSKGSYMIVGGNSPQSTVQYDGTIKGYLMVGMAKCAWAGKLPPGSGFLNLIGDRFNIPLSLVKCDAPVRQVTDVVVTYDGTQNPRCEYQ